MPLLGLLPSIIRKQDRGTDLLIDLRLLQFLMNTFEYVLSLIDKNYISVMR
jgi:hypothetical protein